MQAILLAAGFGTRLWPLTVDRAKPAVPFLGRPLIAGLVQRLEAGGFSRIVVNTHHQPASIEAALDGFRTVRFSHEPEILGTAGGPARARDLGLIDPDDDLLIVNGKLYTEIDFAEVMAAHRAVGAEVTMTLRRNPTRAHFREVLTQGDRVVGFGAGRVPEGPDPRLFTGIHAVSPKVLGSMVAAFTDTIRDVYPPLIEARQVHAHLAETGRWWEFSTPERYWSLHQKAHVEGWAPDVVGDPTAVWPDDDQVRQAVIWAGAHIEPGARVQRAIIGEGVRIRAGEAAQDCIVVRRDRVGDLERGEMWGDRVRVPMDVSAVGSLRS